MRFHKGNVKNKRLKIILTCICMMIVLVFLIDLQIRPYIQKVCKYQCNIIFTNVITESVYSEISTKDSYAYNKLVLLDRDADGNVTSVQNNMNEINKLYATVTDKINTDIDNIKSKDLYIPIGSLSGLNYLYGRGPEVKFKLDPLSSVDAKVASKFSSAGVNQTLHEIVLEVKTNVAAVLPGQTVVVEVKSNYILSSTIIVGKIPDSYTYITGDDRDKISKINDYKK